MIVSFTAIVEHRHNVGVVVLVIVVEGIKKDSQTDPLVR